MPLTSPSYLVKAGASSAGTADGDTHVTAYAPQIASAVGNRAIVVEHWGDAGWTAPPPSAGRPGTEQFLSTSVFQRDNHQPLAGYAVRYRILDGPAAVFLPSQTNETVVVSNTTGAAPVVVAQTTPLAGRTRIGFEVLRGGNVVIGHGDTYVDWQGPNVALSVLLPPSATIGQETPCTLVVNNAGAVDARYLTVRAAIPAGCKLVRTEPLANQQGNELIWTLGAVNGRSQRSLQAVFQADHLGGITVQASLTTEDGPRDDKTATCNVTPPAAPKLNVIAIGPVTGLVGTPVAYQITVQNEGTGPATNVTLKAAFAGGLEYGKGLTQARNLGRNAGGGPKSDSDAAGDGEARRRSEDDGDGLRRRRSRGAGRAVDEDTRRPHDVEAGRASERLCRSTDAMERESHQRRRRDADASNGKRYFASRNDVYRSDGRRAIARKASGLEHRQPGAESSQTIATHDDLAATDAANHGHGDGGGQGKRRRFGGRGGSRQGRCNHPGAGIAGL